MKQRQAERMPERRDARELFNAWNDPSAESDPDELTGAEAWSEAETPEQVLAEGEVAYNYDEWDRGDRSSSRLVSRDREESETWRSQLRRSNKGTAQGRHFVDTSPVPTDEA